MQNSLHMCFEIYRYSQDKYNTRENSRVELKTLCKTEMPRYGTRNTVMQCNIVLFFSVQAEK